MSFTRPFVGATRQSLVQGFVAGLGSGYGLPVPTHFVSQTSTNGFAVGANVGAGTTKAAPWLTIDYAIANAPAGSIVEVNDGTYQAATFYNVVGKNLTIRARQIESVVFTAAAAQTRVVNVNPTAPMMLVLAGIVLDGLGDTTRGATMSSAVGISSGLTLRDCVIRGVTQGHIEGGAVEVINLSLNRVRLEGAISGRPVFASFKDGSCSVDGLALSGVSTSSPDRSAVELVRIVGGVAEATATVRNVSGTFTGPAGQVTNGVVFTNIDGGLMEGNSLSILGGAASLGSLYRCFSNSSTLTANGVIIRRNAGHNGHDGGYCVLIGSDPSTVGNNRHNAPLVEDNDITANAASSVPIHGLMLGWGSGGIVRRNRISGAGHALLAKDWTGGEFRNNSASTFSSNGIYAKGATGTLFAENELNVTIAMTQSAIRVGFDDVSLVPSTGIDVEANTVNYAQANQVIVNVHNDGSDAAFASNVYNVGAALPANPWNYQGTGYATLAAWKAAVEPTAKP